MGSVEDFIASDGPPKRSPVDDFRGAPLSKNQQPVDPASYEAAVRRAKAKQSNASVTPDYILDAASDVRHMLQEAEIGFQKALSGKNPLGEGFKHGVKSALQSLAKFTGIESPKTASEIDANLATEAERLRREYPDNQGLVNTGEVAGNIGATYGAGLFAGADKVSKVISQTIGITEKSKKASAVVRTLERGIQGATTFAAMAPTTPVEGNESIGDKLSRTAGQAVVGGTGLAAIGVLGETLMKIKTGIKNVSIGKKIDPKSVEKQIMSYFGRKVKPEIRGMPNPAFPKAQEELKKVKDVLYDVSEPEKISLEQDAEFKKSLEQFPNIQDAIESAKIKAKDIINSDQDYMDKFKAYGEDSVFYKGKMLDALEQSIQDAIKDNNTGLANNILIPAKNKLKAFLYDLSPKYKEAKLTYSALMNLPEDYFNLSDEALRKIPNTRDTIIRNAGEGTWRSLIGSALENYINKTGESVSQRSLLRTIFQDPEKTSKLKVAFSYDETFVKKLNLIDQIYKEAAQSPGGGLLKDVAAATHRGVALAALRVLQDINLGNYDRAVIKVLTSNEYKEAWKSIYSSPINKQGELTMKLISIAAKKESDQF